MSRIRRLVLVPAVLVFAAVACAGGGAATARQGPFFVTPPAKSTPTTECNNLAYCYGIKGPWVVVPANGEATFLLGCPERAAKVGQFLLGGADSSASSSNIRVWYDGGLGAPLGTLTTQSSLAGLLFHAKSEDGTQGSFQPVVGCISLKQASKRSTVSARQATPSPPSAHAAPTATYRSANVILAPGNDRTERKSCHRNERLVGNWSAVAYGTLGPPVLPKAGAVTVSTRSTGRTVVARVQTAATVPYLIRIQVGAICEP
jgi:hypothetical protein